MRTRSQRARSRWLRFNAVHVARSSAAIPARRAFLMAFFLPLRLADRPWRIGFEFGQPMLALLTLTLARSFVRFHLLTAALAACCQARMVFHIATSARRPQPLRTRALNKPLPPLLR